jgi:hypothetical protein
MADISGSFPYSRLLIGPPLWLSGPEEISWKPRPVHDAGLSPSAAILRTTRYEQKALRVRGLKAHRDMECVAPRCNRP